MIAQEAWEIDHPSRDAWVAVLRRALVPAVVKAPKQWPGWHLTAGITIDAATMYVALWEPGAPRPKELVMGRLGPMPTIVLFLEFVGSSAIHGREMRIAPNPNGRENDFDDPGVGGSRCSDDRERDEAGQQGDGVRQRTGWCSLTHERDRNFATSNMRLKACGCRQGELL